MRDGAGQRAQNPAPPVLGGAGRARCAAVCGTGHPACHRTAQLLSSSLLSVFDRTAPRRPPRCYDSDQSATLREAQGKPFLRALLSSSLNGMKRSQGCWLTLQHCSTESEESCRVPGGLQEHGLPLTQVHEPGTAQEEIFPQLWDQIPPPDGWL